uniref:Uncharacterized protein n=1 Tax=Moniliophthora roreri TaxID=221103 RepID=A0A0W0G0J8_MONRR
MSFLIVSPNVNGLNHRERDLVTQGFQTRDV